MAPPSSQMLAHGRTWLHGIGSCAPVECSSTLIRSGAGISNSVHWTLQCLPPTAINSRSALVDRAVLGRIIAKPEIK